jgi:phosphoadenosine phosphosulfate reductase
MINETVAQIRSQTKGYSPQELLKYVLERFGARIALATSFGAEDQVLTDMLSKTSEPLSIFTLDTGRVPEETYEVMDETRKRYGIDIKVLFPDYEQVEVMVNESGPNLFYESIENRKQCCKVRKIEPLKRGLADLDAWICGLRAEQSTTRTGLERVDWDDTFGLVKICPLANWSAEQVWEYIRENNVPYNKLHDAGYPSIGCEPCTRAVKPGEDIRAGRWWWEAPEHKECGLHLHPEDTAGKQEADK